MKHASLDFLPPAVAAAGLAAFAAVFVMEATSFKTAVVEWARRDLETRTALAAATLREPLATGDFRRIHAFGDECLADGVRFTVLSGPRGVFFDSVRHGADVPETMYASSPCGEYTVRLGLPLDRVLAPFNRAKAGFLLAALVGGAGVLLVFFVTYRQRMRIRELGRLEKFRREFIADISHEIKTPLTGIVGAADLLADGDTLPAEARGRLLGLVKAESARLNALALDILALAKLEDGSGFKPDAADADLAEIAAETVGRFRQRADEAGIRLSLSASGPCVARCDARLLDRALSNLVENALRHSGSPDVSVSVEISGGMAKISVEDHGRGIPREEAERVFERFCRLDASRSSDTGGSGLGLAIVRRIARLHGGNATLAGAKPCGCRFTIAFPA